MCLMKNLGTWRGKLQRMNLSFHTVALSQFRKIYEAITYENEEIRKHKAISD